MTLARDGNAGATDPALLRDVSLSEDLAAFDRLPQPLRRSLAGAPLLFSAEALLAQWRMARTQGMSAETFLDLCEQFYWHRVKETQ